MSWCYKWTLIVINTLIIKCVLITVDCPIGQYPNASDTSMCIPCEIGSYKDVTGAADCITCAFGFSTVNPGSESSTDCHGKRKLLWF